MPIMCFLLNINLNIKGRQAHSYLDTNLETELHPNTYFAISQRNGKLFKYLLMSRSGNANWLSQPYHINIIAELSSLSLSVGVPRILFFLQM